MHADRNFPGGLLKGEKRLHKHLTAAPLNSQDAPENDQPLLVGTSIRIQREGPTRTDVVNRLAPANGLVMLTERICEERSYRTRLEARIGTWQKARPNGEVLKR